MKLGKIKLRLARAKEKSELSVAADAIIIEKNCADV